MQVKLDVKPNKLACDSGTVPNNGGCLVKHPLKSSNSHMSPQATYPAKENPALSASQKL